jgi:hypothetical protein
MRYGSAQIDWRDVELGPPKGALAKKKKKKASAWNRSVLPPVLHIITELVVFRVSDSGVAEDATLLSCYSVSFGIMFTEISKGRSAFVFMVKRSKKTDFLTLKMVTTIICGVRS